jgi:tetratricopeptide (TPR) repeat protein
VIARNTAFTYKGKPLDAKTIGRELNVRYVLEGSVQRGANRMRVNVQLINAESGNHLWAERFDKPVADLFDMQDEIVARLAGALNAQLVAAEARRSEQAPNPDSMDLYFQGLAWLNKGLIPDAVARARSFYERALSADPDNVDALIGSAAADAIEGASAFVANPLAAFVAAEAKLTKALSSVPDHARGHMTLGYVYIYTKRAAEGIAEGEHALALDRNLAHAHSLIGYGKIFVGSRRRNRVSYYRGPAPQSARYTGIHLDGVRGHGEVRTWQLGASGSVVSAVDRGQPKFSPYSFSLGRRPGSAWST